MRPGFRSLTAILAFAASGCLPSAETPAPDEELIRKLASDLSAEEFEVRERAFAQLKEIGEPAWAYLHQYADDESADLRWRVRKLADEFAVLLDEDAKKVPPLLKKLENDEDEMVRAEGLDGLLALGPGGIRLLKRHLSCADALPRMEITPERLSYPPGEAANVRAVVRNAGKGVYWRKAAEYLSLDSDFRPFGEPRPVKDSYGQRTAGGRREMVRRHGNEYYNPIRDWHPLPAGCVLVERVEPVGERTSGFTDLTSTFVRPRPGTITPRLPGSRDTVPLEVASALPIGEKLLGGVRVFCVPDPAKVARNPLLDCEWAFPKGKAGTAGERLEAEIRFSSTEKDKNVRLEAKLARYAWYAVLDDHQVPVKWGSWHSALLERGAGGLRKPEGEAIKDPEDAPRQVKPNQMVEWRLAVPLPEKPGMYSLLAFYEISEGKHGPGWYDPPDFVGEEQGGPDDRLCFGPLCAYVEGLQVSATQKQEERKTEKP